jgi:hypothetical protein
MRIDALKAPREPIVFVTAPNAVYIMWATFALLPAAPTLCAHEDFSPRRAAPGISRAGNETLP